MANKSSTNPITSKHDDWGRDSSNNLPYSGEAVQNWVKEQLDNKAGIFYYDSSNNRFLVFSDEENRDAYLENPTEHASLLIGIFDAPFNYTATATLVDTNSINYIKAGSTGNYIKATFDVLNKQGASIGENVNVTISFRNGSAVTRITRSVAYGSMLSINIDQYLSIGTNSITLSVVGQDTLAATSIGLTYYCIRLELSDTFDISQPVAPTGNLNIAFNIIGSGIKRLEWFIDGQQVPYDSQNDDVTASEASRTKTIPLSSYALTNGRHNLQYRAYIEAGDGTLFCSDVMYRDFIVDNGHLQDYLTVVAFEFPYNVAYGVGGIIDAFDEPIPMYGATQYETKEIKYAVYSPFDVGNMVIALGSNTTTYTASNRNVYTHGLQSFSSGVTYLSFSFGTDILEFNVHFEETKYTDLETITNGLEFVFDKNDSTNKSANRDSWSYNGYSAQMTGFSWTDRSGWTKDGLLIPEGASFVTDFSPLSGDVITTGYTIEMELEAQRVLDDMAVICDLRSNGTGLLITASEASITSRGGVSVSTKYKSGVPLRVSFVINPPTAIRNKNLLFIYIDGILAGAMNYPTSDSFTSNAVLQFHGSQDASVLLKQVRCYSRALSDTEILNNYILYRPTTTELVSVYDRNDILNSNNQPSYEKLSAYTPIIIVTGDVEKLMGFDRSNKGTYVKMDKIEIINNLDPTKNLTILDASMRCQGTSSMDYPRKNFRFYLKKDGADTTVDSYVTRVFDYQGTELTGSNRKYSFKEGAQPVACWCLKADYAESSSTHNTGVARLWNTVMKNAVVNDIDSRHYVLNTYPESKTPCRTLAQHAAQAAGYDKDVRTTVDGMPIVLFYHKNESDALICLGKYNWNNDKSTESVYGFVDIPGFDDSNVECWEVVNGDYPANTFDDVSSWDILNHTTLGWRNAFEARYPDDHEKASEAIRAEGALKTVCTWINSTKGAAKVQDGEMVVDNATKMNTFSTEKWNHLDVYKVAAYYVYLMRFGGVDQTVKNAMFTTEDGIHWFYINYDNDTILGVRNDGLLKFGYDITRQSKDPENENAYCYAGHDSVLWNNLEADAEFMGIVKVVDQALFNAGLTYPNVINMFNTEQSGKWSERLHNYDYTFKYLDVWLDDQNMQLEKLQGPRRTHREWWLSNRFAIYDAINQTGQYKNSTVDIKPVTGTVATTGDSVFVTPQVDGQIFGWYEGLNSDTDITVGQSGVPIEFDLVGHTYYIGSPFHFCNAVYMQKIDFSAISHNIQELHLESVNSDVFDSFLEEIIVSDTNSVTNTTMSGINGINYVKYLKKIQMCNCAAVLNVDLSSNIYLEEADFRNCSSLTSVNFPEAAPITTIQLPNSIQSLEIKDLTELETLSIASNGPSLRNIKVSNCAQFNESISWIKTWITGKTDEYLAGCTVDIEGVDWRNVEIQDLVALGKIGHITIKGKIQANFSNDPSEEVIALQAIYGEHCLEFTNDIWIYGNTVYSELTGPSTIVEGQTAQYTFIVIGAAGSVRYEIRNNNRPGVTINSLTGQVVTTLNNEEDSDLWVYAYFTPQDQAGGEYLQSSMMVTVLKETYPSASNIIISGDSVYYDSNDKTYTAVITDADTFTGMPHLTHQWTLTGDIADYYYIASQPSDSLSCVISNSNGTYIVVEGTLTLSLINSLGTMVTEKSISLMAQSSAVAVTRFSNPELMTLLWNKFGTNGTVETGRIVNADYVTKFEASTFTSSEITASTKNNSFFYGSGLKHFEEIKWFTGLTAIPKYLFYGLKDLTGEMEFPDSVTSVNLTAFAGSANAPKLSKISGNGVTTVSSVTEQAVLRVKTVSFPNCTSWAGSYAAFTPPNSEISTIYIPKCTTFGGIFYQQGRRVKLTCAALLANNGTTSSSNGFVELTITKYAEPTTSFGWYNGTNNFIYSIELEEDVTNFEVVDGCLYDVASHILLRAGTSVSSATIKSNTTQMASRAFLHCSIASIDIPSGVTQLGAQVFASCASLMSVIIPSSVTTVGSGCFLNCGNLTTAGPSTGDYSIKFGWTTSIPADALNYGSSSATNQALVGITIPSTITSIGNNAFRYQTKIETLYFYPTTAPTLGTNVFDSVGTTNASAGTNTLYIPSTSSGYGTGQWASPLCDSGGGNFQVSSTL